MRSQIEAADLIDAAEAFLREIEGDLAGRRKFHAKVAANALAIAARELRQQPHAVETAALRKLEPAAAETDLASDACARIRLGAWTPETPGLLDALEVGIVARLAVDNPKFSTLKRLKEAADDH